MKQVVFLTGSASGVGLHLTDRFIREGYHVVATDINFADLKALARERNWGAKEVMIRKLDVTQKSQWQKLWGDVLEKWQRVDIILNVAGYLKPGFIHETDLEEIDRHININVKGLMLGSKFAAQTMVEQGRGHIVNIASLAGLAPVPGIGLYSASKFAVRGFTLALAQELKPHHVDVTVICPDAIETPMLTLQEDYEEAAVTFSGRKSLTVEDIGRLVFDKVLASKPMEVMIPTHRGLLAKLSGAIPYMVFLLGDHFKKMGRAEQEKRLRQK